MRILVTGSTLWTDSTALRREFASLPGPCTVVTGDCPGIDAIAQEVAAELGWPVEAMKKNRADARAHPGVSWKGLNERMLATGIDLVLAFHADLNQPDSARGTKHMLALAEQAGVRARAFTC